MLPSSVGLQEIDFKPCINPNNTNITVGDQPIGQMIQTARTTNSFDLTVDLPGYYEEVQVEGREAAIVFIIDILTRMFYSFYCTKS